MCKNNYLSTCPVNVNLFWNCVIYYIPFLSSLVKRSPGREPGTILETSPGTGLTGIGHPKLE